MATDPPPPAAGWCITRHRPKRAAQSGYDFFCKTCYRDLFPERHAAKQKKRKHTCRFCMATKDLARGACKSCTRMRTCSACQATNDADDPARCVSCQDGLQLWCVTCTSVEDRGMGLCNTCFRSRSCSRCSICKQVPSTPPRKDRCTHPECEAIVHVCRECELPPNIAQPLLCRPCGYKLNMPCRACGDPKSQRALEFRQCCRVCFARRFCDQCRRSSIESNLSMCRRCAAMPALWCSHCHTSESISRGLCVHCHELPDTCTYCEGSLPSTTSRWLPCAEASCVQEVFVRDACEQCHPAIDEAQPRVRAVHCYTCWRERGKLLRECPISIVPTSPGDSERVRKWSCHRE